MRISKILKSIELGVIVLLLFISIGCKKPVNDKIENLDIKKTEEVVKKNIDKSKTISFTISCGSGCAMIYYEQTIVSNEVTFKVETYINEVLSEDDLVTYIIEGSNGIASKVYLKGDINNILDSELPMMKEEFQKYANSFCSKYHIENSVDSEVTSLIYNKKINIKDVKYDVLNEKIIGIEKFLCEERKIRFIKLPKKDNISLILVPQDCGDFNYRFYLLTIYENKVISNEYVEGEWYEPEDNSYKEITSFSIDESYIIEVKTNSIESGKTTLKEVNRFKISDKGVLEKIK